MIDMLSTQQWKTRTNKKPEHANLVACCEKQKYVSPQLSTHTINQSVWFLRLPRINPRQIGKWFAGELQASVASEDRYLEAELPYARTKAWQVARYPWHERLLSFNGTASPVHRAKRVWQCVTAAKRLDLVFLRPGWALGGPVREQHTTRSACLSWIQSCGSLFLDANPIKLTLSTLVSIASSQTWIGFNRLMQTSKLVILSEGFLHCHLKPAWRGKWCTRDTANVPHCPKAQSPASYNRGLISVTAWHIPGQYSIHGQGKPPAHHPNRYHSQRAETVRQIILHDAVWHT
jgi:hypothetical protein